MTTPFVSRRWFVVTGLLLAGCQSEIPRETKPAGTPAAASGGTAATAPAGSAKRIVILTNGSSPFWDACGAGINDANRDLNLAEAGYVGELARNDGTTQGQLDKLRQFAGQTDVVALGISVTESDNAAIAEELRKFRERGIPVVTIDSDVDRDRFRDARHAFIGTDNLVGGRVLGQCAKGLRPDGGEYVTFVGLTSAQNAIERIGGFGEGAGDKFVNKGSMADQTDESTARENVRNALGNHPQLNTLVGIWSYNAPAIVDVVRDLKVREKIAVVVFDAEPLTIKYMQDGDVDAMVVQNPYAMGFEGVRMLRALLEKDEKTQTEMLPNHGQPGGDIFDTGLKVVVPNEQSPLKADQFSGKVQFMPLKEFQEWLKKYGLTMS